MQKGRFTLSILETAIPMRYLLRWRKRRRLMILCHTKRVKKNRKGLNLPVLFYSIYPFLTLKGAASHSPSFSLSSLVMSYALYRIGIS